MSKKHEQKGLFFLRTQTSGVSRFILESSGQVIQASKISLQSRNNYIGLKKTKLEVWCKFQIEGYDKEKRIFDRAGC